MRSLKGGASRFLFVKRGVVTISYNDLKKGKDLTAAVYEAYGPNGLGALTISDIPNFAEQRKKLLPLGYRLAHLPQKELAKLEHPESMWNAGWSHGKEKIGDEPDFHKGSFYANPLYDVMASPDQVAKYPFFYPNNIWPSSVMPEVEPAFKQLGRTMYDTVLLLCQQIDALTRARVPSYPAGQLARQLGITRKIKGRLLYYYPSDAETITEDGWIGWHNDSGFLTALTSALFFDDATGKEIKNPDPQGGLWVVDRKSSAVKVDIPADHLAVQCGECLQIMTGGLLVATPHSVRPSKAPDGTRVGRATFPVFIDTPADFPLRPPAGVSREKVFDKTVQSKVPPLETRWTKDGVAFVDFLGDTFKQYYEWAKKN